MTKLATMLSGSPYQGYSYAYPHKTAYRPLPAAVDLRELWANEDRNSLFLYLHVPFCEMRCGFCNLFTQANPRKEAANNYLSALEREACEAREALGDAQFARIAIGGGTPTFLDIAGLERLFRLMKAMGAEPRKAPLSVETSPDTIDDEKLALLKDWGTTRISIGVQSFLESETSAVMRPQKRTKVDEALSRLRDARLPVLNIDLIYGMPGQTVESWLTSVRHAMEYRPRELYLYPLYVRPVTGLGRAEKAWDDLRLGCYREARRLLLDCGYEQVSMRMFSMKGASADAGPVYCCQDDGMVGLGCGARSYTRGLHYSREFAVGAAHVRAILADYIARPSEAFRCADYGYALNPEDQRHRYLIQSLLQVAGLSISQYRQRFGGDVITDFVELDELESRGLAQRTPDRFQLTPAGMELSDLLGPWLYSSQVVELMTSYETR
jgi:oxygen-independent coproporphyrinogen III oxidase